VNLLGERIEQLGQDIAAQVEASQQQLTEMIVQLDKRLETTSQARFQALKRQVTELDTLQRNLFAAVGIRLDHLDDIHRDRLREAFAAERKLTTQKLDALQQVGQTLACAQHDQLGELGAALANTFEQGLNRLNEAQQARLTEERALTTQRLEALDLQLAAGIEDAQENAAALNERVQQLEQAPLKRFWRWLTRQGRKNGKTL
jgi:hypothetical protein